MGFFNFFLFQLLSQRFYNRAITIISPGKHISTNAFFQGLLDNLIAIGFLVAVVIFVLILVLGAFEWISSGGDRGKIEDARRKITNGIVGIIVLFLIWLILQIMAFFLGINVFSLGSGIPTIIPLPTYIPPTFTPTPIGGGGGTPTVTGGATPTVGPTPTNVYMPNCRSNRSCEELCADPAVNPARISQMCRIVGTDMTRSSNSGDRRFYEAPTYACTLTQLPNMGCWEPMNPTPAPPVPACGTNYIDPSCNLPEWTNCLCRNGAFYQDFSCDEPSPNSYYRVFGIADNGGLGGPLLYNRFFGPFPDGCADNNAGQTVARSEFELFKYGTYGNIVQTFDCSNGYVYWRYVPLKSDGEVNWPPNPGPWPNSYNYNACAANYPGYTILASSEVTIPNRGTYGAVHQAYECSNGRVIFKYIPLLANGDVDWSNPSAVAWQNGGPTYGCYGVNAGTVLGRSATLLPNLGTYGSVVESYTCDMGTPTNGMDDQSYYYEISITSTGGFGTASTPHGPFPNGCQSVLGGHNAPTLDRSEFTLPL